MAMSIANITPIIGNPPAISVFGGLQLPQVDFRDVVVRLGEQPSAKATVGIATQRQSVPKFCELGGVMQSIGRKYDNVTCAISHCLFGNASGANVLTEILAARFLEQEADETAVHVEAPDGVPDNNLTSRKPRKKKTKLPVLKALRCLSRANRDSVDFVVVDGENHAVSVFTRSAHAQQGKRVLVALLFHPTDQMFEPCVVSSVLSLSRRSDQEAAQALRESESDGDDDRASSDAQPAFTSVEVNQQDSGRDDPFKDLRYPDVVMSSTGFCQLLGISCSKHFGKSRFRNFLVVFSPLAAVALCISVLILAPRHSAPCCTLFNSCVTNISLVMSNSSIIQDPFGICTAEMCGTEGILFQEAFNAFFYGALVSPGRLLVAVIGVELVALLGALLVLFFMIRALAQRSARQLFWRIGNVVHVLFSGLGLGLAVVAASALHSENPHVMQCDAFSNTARPLCLADYAACNLRSAIVFDKSNLSGTLIIAVAVACGVNVLAALVSPNLGLSQAMTQVRPSRPDTMIFRPAKYAPDGLTDAEAGDLCAKSRNDILIKLEAPEEREGVVMVESARSRSSVSARRLRSPRGVPHKALQAARFLASLKTGGFSNHHQGQAMVYHVETVPVPRTPSLPPVIERQILSIASRVQAAVPGASVTLASAEVPH